MIELGPVQLVILPTLTTSTDGGGTVSIDPPDGAYLSDSTAIVTALPSAGWSFLQWLGDASGTNPTASVAMTRNKCVQAIFGTAVNTSVAGNGSISLNPPGGLYPYGTDLLLTAVPQSGNYLALWGNPPGATNNPLRFVVVDTNQTLTAVFQPLTAGKFAVTALADGNGRVAVSPQANRYTNGQPVTLTATPDAAQQFTGWSGDASGAQNPLSVSMTKSRIITANFTRKPYLSVVRCQGQLNDQTFEVSLKGGFGVQYEIESTVDLVQWGPITNLTTTFGTAQFSDPFGASLNRYYRAFAVPAPVGTNLVFIPPGTFTMGSPTNEAERFSDETQHTVTISRGFWMGKYLVTQGDYLAVVGSSPSLFCLSTGFSVDLTCPVEGVTWFEATNYCGLRTQQEHAAGLIPSNYVYRLPTEAEWEYACRAGTTTAFYLGSGLKSGQANFDGHYEYDATLGTTGNPGGVFIEQTTAVGSYAANGWG
jgi:formylglycine-generating enzyme required for sulfatase activity